MLIDTHVHLALMIELLETVPPSPLHREQIRKIIQEADQDMVTTMITISTTLADSMQALMLAYQHENVYAAIGIHPTHCRGQWRQDVTELKKLIAKKDASRVVAIGECGIDLYHQGSSLSQQKDLFRAQIELALNHDLPLIIHSRNAPDETLSVLDEMRDAQLRGVIHCFSYDKSEARDFFNTGFLLGIGGTVTYPKNEILREIVSSCAGSQFVLETDAPFLPPQPWRGKQNHPRHLRYIAEQIASFRATTYEDISRITTDNARTLFRLHKHQ